MRGLRRPRILQPRDFERDFTVGVAKYGTAILAPELEVQAPPAANIGKRNQCLILKE